MDKIPQAVEYIPPKSETIRAFARRVCEALASQSNDASFLQPQTIQWFANLLELAAHVQAKHLNAQQLVDTDEK